MKEAIAIPVAPAPEKELCAYEKIREDIIKEREAAMAKCKFFEDLDQLKKDVGFETKDNKEAIKRKPKKKPAKKIKKREKYEHKMLNDDSSEKEVEKNREGKNKDEK